jgi:hypothetical protein
MKNLTTFLLLCFFTTTAMAQLATSEIEQKLFGLPDLIFKQIEHPAGFEAAFELHVKQPIDHEDPSKGHFYQRAYLSHRSFDAPMVIATEGYTRSANRMYELTHYLNANQVDVEHRYFGTSTPEQKDYQYLNLKQATADLHHIRQLLGSLYQEDWVSTGISKGGQTTIFYRYFYPEDVTASVPYVAPLNLELKEKRIYQFLDTIGTDACRNQIRKVQTTLLEQRKAVLPRLKWYAKGAKYQFTYLSLEEAFEYAVLEYSFSFWQSGIDCASIPDVKQASLDELLDHFMEVIGLSLYVDDAMEVYGSHYWQAGTEMGYYGFETAPFKKLLKVLSGEPSAVFMPEKAPMTFEPSLVKSAYEWTQSEASEMIYIYGGIDTWTATGVPPTEKAPNSHWFILDGKSHYDARIKNMSEKDRNRLLGLLEQWMNQ